MHLPHPQTQKQLYIKTARFLQAEPSAPQKPDCFLFKMYVSSDILHFYLNCFHDCGSHGTYHSQGLQIRLLRQ